MQVTFRELFPWERMPALRAAATADFLAHENEIATTDGHAAWCCNQIRQDRGLPVVLARNYNFTAVAI